MININMLHVGRPYRILGHIRRSMSSLYTYPCSPDSFWASIATSPFGSHIFRIPSVSRYSPLRIDNQLGSVTCESHLALMRILNGRSREGVNEELEVADVGIDADDVDACGSKEEEEVVCWLFAVVGRLLLEKGPSHERDFWRSMSGGECCGECDPCGGSTLSIGRFCRIFSASASDTDEPGPLPVIKGMIWPSGRGGAVRSVNSCSVTLSSSASSLNRKRLIDATVDGGAIQLAFVRPTERSAPSK